MQPKVKTSAGMETAAETLARAKAMVTRGTSSTPTTPAPTNMPTGPAATRANPLLEALTSRLLQQTQGISSSSSSALQNSINEAIAGTQQAGSLASQALQSEREREVAFAQDRAGATYTTALEGRTGYATQVTALRELTETTEKSIRDLDKRYQEAILSNDAATAQRIADLQVKKIEFQMEQEQNFFNNLISVGNLQQQALQQQQQDEQFWIKKQQEDEQFVAQMSQSNYQFERNYGLALQDFGLKEKQLELERQKFNLSAREYADRKAALTSEKNRTQTQAIIANDIKNKFLTGQFTKEQFMDTNYMATVADMTGFDGTTEELSSIILAAVSDVNNAGVFNQTAVTETPATPTAFTQDVQQFGGFLSQLINSQNPATSFIPGVSLARGARDIFGYFTKPVQ